MTNELVKRPLIKKIRKVFLSNWRLYVLLLPALLWLFVFRYTPMYGLTLAFKDFSIRKGILDSPWVGLKYFRQFFSTSIAWTLVKNTLILSLESLAFVFPIPIIFALFLNQLRYSKFKKIVQTISFAPYFISNVVVISIMTVILAPGNGFVNIFLQSLGCEPLMLMTKPEYFWITFIRPGLYRLDDWFMASAYLIEGEKKALLIDTTMTHAHVDEVVKRITRLPVELAITHPHRDHMLHAFEFEKVYIHEDDRKAMYDCIHGMYDMKAGKVPQRPQTNTYPEYMDQLDHFHQVVGLKDGDVIDLGGTTIEMMYLGGHTQHDVVFADHTHRCLFTGDAVGSGYVVGVRYEKNRFHETYAWYRDNLERFIGRMKGKEDYTCFGGHFIQENSCMDEMQEDYLNNQSEYFVPLSWKVIEDMYVLAGELADGMHDKEAHLDTGEEFFARHGSAMLAGSRLP